MSALHDPKKTTPQGGLWQRGKCLKLHRIKGLGWIQTGRTERFSMTLSIKP